MERIASIFSADDAEEIRNMIRLWMDHRLYVLRHPKKKVLGDAKIVLSLALSSGKPPWKWDWNTLGKWSRSLSTTCGYSPHAVMRYLDAIWDFEEYFHGLRVGLVRKPVKKLRWMNSRA